MGYKGVNFAGHQKLQFQELFCITVTNKEIEKIMEYLDNASGSAWCKTY